MCMERSPPPPPLLLPPYARSQTPGSSARQCFACPCLACHSSSLLERSVAAWPPSIRPRRVNRRSYIHPAAGVPPNRWCHGTTPYWTDPGGESSAVRNSCTEPLHILLLHLPPPCTCMHACQRSATAVGVPPRHALGWCGDLGCPKIAESKAVPVT